MVEIKVESKISQRGDTLMVPQGPDEYSLQGQGFRVGPWEGAARGGRAAECGRRVGTEMKPLEFAGYAETGGLATTYFKHTKNLGKEQNLVFGQNKWHKAHACFHSL